MPIKTLLLVVFAAGFVSLAVPSSRISDESYRLLQQLLSYKNREIDDLHSLNQYMVDCEHASDEALASKKCSDRLAAMQNEDREMQVKHDQLAQAIATHMRQHRDEEWFFTGLEDKEFNNFAH
jgi:formate-dependent nitrite reductase cytochrome c552 subunit